MMSIPEAPYGGVKVEDHKNDEEEGEVEGEGAGWLAMDIKHFAILFLSHRSVNCCKEIKVLSLFLFLFLLIVALVPLSFLLSVTMTGQVCWCWGC